MENLENPPLEQSERQSENINPPQAEVSFFEKLKTKWPIALGALGTIALFAAIIYAAYSYSNRGQEAQPTPTSGIYVTPAITPLVTPEVSLLPTVSPTIEKYITERYECLAYGAQPGSDKKDGYMILVYPESVTVTKNPYNDCDFLLNYKKGSLRIAYVGEAFPYNLDENYLRLKEENGVTLVRNPLKLITDGTNKLYYYTNYSRLLDDSGCVANDFSPDLRPPCAGGGHPFVTMASIFSTEISKDTTESERQEIVKVFDDIAIKSSGGRY